MDIASLSEENATLKALLEQTRAALAEHQAALAASEEPRRRLENMLGDLRRAKFGAKSEKLNPDQYNLVLERSEERRVGNEWRFGWGWNEDKIRVEYIA